MNVELKNRLLSGWWVFGVGVVSTLITLASQNIEAFELSPLAQTLTVLVLTAIGTQITKYLNNLKRNKEV